MSGRLALRAGMPRVGSGRSSDQRWRWRNDAHAAEHWPAW